MLSSHTSDNERPLRDVDRGPIDLETYWTPMFLGAVLRDNAGAFGSTLKRRRIGACHAI